MNVVDSTLALFDVPWTLTATRPVTLDVRETEQVDWSPATGDFLVAAQMLVDPTPRGMRATTTHGAEIEGAFDAESEHWRMRVPRQLVDEDRRPEIEDLVSLIVTAGWRRAG